MVKRRSRRADQQCLLLRELRDDRLTNIKAVNENAVAAMQKLEMKLESALSVTQLSPTKQVQPLKGVM